MFCEIVCSSSLDKSRKGTHPKTKKLFLNKIEPGNFIKTAGKNWYHYRARRCTSGTILMLKNFDRQG